jgi:aspartyl protease family protein
MLGFRSALRGTTHYMGTGRFPSGHLTALAIWLAIFAAVYAFMDSRLKPTVATATTTELARGEIVIPRSRDGHYYLRGSINGTPLVFMVDTGASLVSVSAELARKAALPRGAPGQFATAGGEVQGEIVPGQSIEAGGIRVAPLSVAVGFSGDVALLGQNFLRRVDVLQSDDRMVLRLRTSP